MKRWDRTIDFTKGSSLIKWRVAYFIMIRFQDKGYYIGNT